LGLAQAVSIAANFTTTDSAAPNSATMVETEQLESSTGLVNSL
jgi:hypothetical protein